MAFALFRLLSVSLILAGCCLADDRLPSGEAPGNTHPGIVGGHIPILYEAYYPREPRKWASLQEIERLREMTSRLLREEERLARLAAAAAEDVLQPRSQLLEYVISGAEPRAAEPGIASLTVSDSGPRRTRHQHGEPNWLLRRLRGAGSSAR